MASRPKEIRKLPSALQILWEDGRAVQVEGAWLRAHCTCAVCREFKNPPDYSDPRFERSCRIQSLEAVGNYALGIMFGDAHKSIFAFDRLSEYKA